MMRRFSPRVTTPPMPADTPENREMYKEIAALVAALGKAFARSEGDIISALEKGEIALDFGQDENANRFVMATFAGKTARVYQGAIKQETDPA